ncbi:NADP-dependent oxidoreductase [Nesterenkonia xinjiangensis]|uniref:NADPH:quinone reductase-like Zn-dependent oxidoreductase n=1 Tax=Nesterenkonia xinjiangensis TaxID=225327 RepID=A0A7Z0GLD0_9MICC|nr:NADP-dependent oxidoreductase [Nesterenkonia xinjiangensis]NYJ77574.1 NADPH:quinone reductase-like Zn-dependent oxidoreductase [Nesterenkonia xinjiangensis]
MNATMRAAAIDAFGPPERLQVRELPRPVMADDDVLVRVRAAGVQLTDAAVRAGWTPPGAVIRLPQILGNEFSGTVEEVGEGVTRFRPGDEVLGFRLLGCYAEYVAVPESQVVMKPRTVGWHAAGALSASGQTAHTAFEDLAVERGDVVLVHGAAGGVGTVFTQLAVQAGATVVGTASQENHDYLRSLGAIPVAYGPGQRDRIRSHLPRADAAFDAAGHQNLRDAVHFVADRQRIATIVDMPLAQELGCRIVRSRRSARRLADLVDRLDRGVLRIHVRRRYPLDAVADAHRDVESGHGRGKVLLDISEEA